MSYKPRSCDGINFINKIINKFKSIVELNLEDLIKQNIHLDLSDTSILNEKDAKEHLKQEKDLTMLSFKIPELRNYGCIAIETKLALIIVDQLLGYTDASQYTKSKEHDKKGTTLIEKSIIKQILQIFLVSLSKSLSAYGTITFIPDVISSEIQFQLIKDDSEQLIYMQSLLKLNKLSGKIITILPYNEMQNISKKSADHFEHNKAQTDQIWQQDLKNVINSIEMNLDIAINGKQIKEIQEVMAWKIGETIPIAKISNESIHAIQLNLICENIKLGKGKACEKSGQLGMLLEEVF